MEVVPNCVPLRVMVYPLTATLSVDGDQFKLTVFCVLVAVRLAGVDGGVVSNIGGCGETLTVTDRVTLPLEFDAVSV